MATSVECPKASIITKKVSVESVLSMLFGLGRWLFELQSHMILFSGFLRVLCTWIKASERKT